jgi:hypothetical protein
MAIREQVVSIENRNDGMVEYWNNGILETDTNSTLP